MFSYIYDVEIYLVICFVVTSCPKHWKDVMLCNIIILKIMFLIYTAHIICEK